MKYFVSGIHTDAGKSYCTGWFARRLMDEGKKVLTQKFIQTGNNDMSEDIEVHRRIMGTGYFPEDLDHTTAPLIFTHPCSPQLAARLDHRDIDLNVIDRSSETLEGKCDVLLIEGAGGLMVPITDDYFTIDYVASHRLPTVLVTNGRLGSINHTILSLEALASRGIELVAVVYNRHFDKDKTIAADTFGFIKRYLASHFPAAELIDMPDASQWD